MVHVSNIQVGARANSAADLLSRGQQVKVKIMSLAGNRVGLSMKDVDQTTGGDFTPHPHIKSEAELAEEEWQRTSRSLTRTNADSFPFPRSDLKTSHLHPRVPPNASCPRNDRKLSSLFRRVPSTHEWHDLNKDSSNPVARTEVEEELNIEVHEDELSFPRGQTKRTFNLSPVKVVKAPGGSLNRAEVHEASLAKDRRELRHQVANDQTDLEAQDCLGWVPWPKIGAGYFRGIYMVHFGVIGRNVSRDGGHRRSTRQLHSER